MRSACAPRGQRASKRSASAPATPQASAKSASLHEAAANEATPPAGCGHQTIPPEAAFPAMRKIASQPLAHSNERGVRGRCDRVSTVPISISLTGLF